MDSTIIIKKTLLGIIFFGNLIIIIALWFSHSGSLLTVGGYGVYIALGRLVGLLAEFLILVQLVLIGRIRVVEQLFGFDKLNRIHRWIGYCWIFFIPLHPLLLTIGYAQSSHVSWWSQFLDFLYNWEDVFKAFLGLLLLMGIITISYAIIRRRLKYETWYFIHVFVYVSIFLIFGHQTNTADVSQGSAYYYWYILNFIVFGLVLLYRFLRPLYMAWRHEFRVEKIVQENSTITSIYISGKDLEKFKVQAGQYAHMTFLQKKMWFTHPFSFSAAPNGKTLRLSIKQLGDFTTQVPTLKPNTRVIIDGPFGIFTERIAQRHKFLFIAGGIGITPIYSVIESMSQKPEKKDMVLLYGNRSPEETAFLRDLEKLNAKVIPVYSHVEIPGAETGFINAEKIKRLVPDFLDREIYICGPTPMMKSVIKALQDMGAHHNQLHYERFGY